MILTWSTATSGFMAALSTALFKVVMVVVAQETGDPVVMGVEDVVVGARVVVSEERATTRLTASRTMVLTTAEVLTAGLTIVVILATSTEGVTGAVVLASTSSNIEDGLKPAAKISGSHFTLIGAITENLEGCGV